MTEFALIVPVFLLIVAGLLAFGRVFFYWIEANHLASETARWAVVDRNPYSPSSLQQHVRGSVVQLGIAKSTAKISALAEALSDGDVGDTIQFRVQSTRRVVQGIIESQHKARLVNL